MSSNVSMLGRPLVIKQRAGERGCVEVLHQWGIVDAVGAFHHGKQARIRGKHGSYAFSAVLVLHTELIESFKGMRIVFEMYRMRFPQKSP